VGADDHALIGEGLEVGADGDVGDVEAVAQVLDGDPAAAVHQIENSTSSLFGKH